jgi:pimeloyl-ACP methyl ester carboxylesterase
MDWLTPRRPIAPALALGLMAATATAQQAAPAAVSRASSFTVFLRAVPIGSEQMAVERTAEGWTITSSGRIGAPVDLVSRLVEVRYTSDWKPLSLLIDGQRQGQLLTARTTVAGAVATTQFTQAGQSGQKRDAIAPEALLLPSPFWGPFEALSQRLKDAPAGSSIQGYDLQGTILIEVGGSSSETIDVGGRTVHARRTAFRSGPPGAPPIDAEIWGDENGRLLRISVPAQNLEVVREDIVSVAARRVNESHAGDEQVRITANGFSLAGTISRPADAQNRPRPAVTLVAGSGPADRDETMFGIPIFGQLAGALADAGFLVLRYDKRGVGQSGGRAEAATLTDYADDLRAAIKFLADRKDVDRKRLAIVGHGEGGSVAMLAAAKDDRIAAVVLIDALGVTGAELNLAQVTHAVGRSSKSDADRQATVELQKKIQLAVLTGSGWEGIPLPLRRQAEIPWFKSFLAFDPAKPMSEMPQPLLIVQSLLDTQVSPQNADRLQSLASSRKKGGPAEVVRVPGVNHLLVPATTGEVDEYASLTDKHISPKVTAAVAVWLQKLFPIAKP